MTPPWLLELQKITDELDTTITFDQNLITKMHQFILIICDEVGEHCHLHLQVEIDRTQQAFETTSSDDSLSNFLVYLNTWQIFLTKNTSWSDQRSSFKDLLSQLLTKNLAVPGQVSRMDYERNLMVRATQWVSLWKSMPS